MLRKILYSYFSSCSRGGRGGAPPFPVGRWGGGAAGVFFDGGGGVGGGGGACACLGGAGRFPFGWPDHFLILKIEDPAYQDTDLPNSTNPYRVPLDSLPLRNTICLVDSASVFVCPNQTKVFSRFGYRHGRRHQGADLPYKTGTPVVAAFDGRVRVSDYSGGYGNLIVIRHENGLETYYGHLSKREVEVGDWVRAGDQIGLGGSTGRSTGPHLHFETRWQGFAFDPEWIADFEKGQLRSNVFVLRRSYLNAGSHYVPESLDEEEDLYAAEEKILAEEKRLAAERAAVRYYTVKSGDTLGAIAKRQGKSLNAILKLNPGVNSNQFRIGQKIRVNNPARAQILRYSEGVRPVFALKKR